MRHSKNCWVQVSTASTGFTSQKKPILANVTGGLSGPAVFPVALRMVYQTANAVSIPVIGMGGVSSADDVLEMMMAGAAAVEVGAANLTDPYASRDIVRDLPAAMKKYGISRLSGGIQPPKNI